MYFGTPQNRENGVFVALLYNCVLATVKKKKKNEVVDGLSRRGCHRSDIKIFIKINIDLH